ETNIQQLVIHALDESLDEGYVQDLLTSFDQISGVEGAGAILDTMLDGAGSSLTGAEFQLAWVSQHRAEVTGIEVLRSVGWNDAADVRTVENGQTIYNELKCYNFDSSFFQGAL